MAPILQHKYERNRLKNASNEANKVALPHLGKMKSASASQQDYDLMTIKKLKVYARLPSNNGYVGTFHYAPSAGNSAFIFFEKMIVLEEDIEKLHRIKVHPFTGCFHSKPGHYSKLHGLNNYTNKNESDSMSEESLRKVVLGRIRSSLVKKKPSMARVNSSPNIAEIENNSLKSNVCIASIVRENHKKCLKWGQDFRRSQPEISASENLQWKSYKTACDVKIGKFGEKSLDDAATCERQIFWGSEAIHWSSGTSSSKRACKKKNDFVSHSGLEQKFEEQRNRSGLHSLGWHSHTIKAHEKTEAYLQELGHLAPKMKTSDLLNTEITKSYNLINESKTDFLGEGVTGTVRLGLHIETGRAVAIKTIKKMFLHSREEKENVNREIANHRRLCHKHIVRLYETYDTEDEISLVLERALHGSLGDLLFIRRFLSELEAKIVLKQVLDAIQHCHSQGIVHCDIKPANVLLFESNCDADSDYITPARAPTSSLTTQISPSSISSLVVKVCDFGHSRKVPDIKYFKYTRNIHKIPHHLFQHTGTGGYIAPEVLSKQSYGKSVDMWSFGAMMHQLLSGKLPAHDRGLNISGKLWSQVSDHAKELLSLVLEEDPGKRISAFEATNHSWFDGIEHCAAMPIHSLVDDG